MKPANRGRKTKPRLTPVYQSKTYAAPVRGLNFRDSLAMMKPTDALRLDNLVCRPGYLQVRKGKVATATGFTAPVETLLGYVGVNGVTKLFAAAGANIFDATSSGPIGAAVLTGLTSAYWAQIQVSNTAGNFLICVNGQDTGRIYDGSTWAALGFTGLATASMTQLAVWKRRVWIVEKNSFKAWYGAADAISGALTVFPFQGIFKKGGRLQAIINWTIDGGAGSDDYLLAVTSMGEVAIYKGTDPSSAATFALVGTYFIGPPVGERFYASFGGDVLMLTSEGLIPISKYLQSATVDKTTILSDRIQLAISRDLSAYGTVRGWEVHVFYDDNFLFIQVPAGEAPDRYQWVMSLLDGAWSRFLQGGALTWLPLGNTLYNGEATEVNNAWASGTDNGTAIPYTVIPAFTYFDHPTNEKIFGLGRCLIEADVPPTFTPKLLVDFNQFFYLPTLAPSPGLGNIWDVGIWDASSWGDALSYSKSWYSLSGIGYSATQVIFGVSAANLTKIIALDYTYEVGGLL